MAKMDDKIGLSSVFPNQRNVVLLYHSIGTNYGTGGYVISKEEFEKHIEMLSKKFEIVDLPDVLKKTKQKRVAITFDDGHKSFAEDALPILREYKIPVTVFLISNFVSPDGVNDLSIYHHTQPGRKWINSDNLMKLEEIKEIAKEDLVTFGNHTKNHLHLTNIRDERKIRDEIQGAKTDLEELLGTDVNRFCYPYGDYDSRSAEIVADTHDYATKVAFSTIRSDTDPIEIPRKDAELPLPTLKWQMTDFSDDIEQLVRSSKLF